jgi:hypothetical protein
MLLSRPTLNCWTLLDYSVTASCPWLTASQLWLTANDFRCPLETFGANLQKTRNVVSIRCCVTYCLRGSVFTEPLPRKWLHNPAFLLLRARNAGCLSSRCLAMRWHVTVYYSWQLTVANECALSFTPGASSNKSCGSTHVKIKRYSSTGISKCLIDFKFANCGIAVVFHCSRCFHFSAFYWLSGR